MNPFKFTRQKVTEYLIARAYRSVQIKNILDADVKRWIPDFPGNPTIDVVATLLMTRPEFRSLFFYRAKAGTRLLRLIYPPESTLYICTKNIGPGLFIQHGFSTIISAKTIGSNCWINQQVTIGYSDATNCPEIGDGVTINAGALVIGGITIGDRVRIGAGAVVVRSVPSDCTVVGNPARIVRRNGIRCDEKL